MKLTEVIFLRGIPGSGKSEWSRAFCSGVNGGVKVLSFDATLAHYDSAGYQSDYSACFAKNHKEVMNLMYSELTAAVSSKSYDFVIVDNLHLDYDQVCKVAEAVKNLGVTVKLVNFFVSVEESIRRQTRRSAHLVSKDKVETMHHIMENSVGDAFPGDVVTHRFDTQELFTCHNEFDNFGDLVLSECFDADVDPSKTLVIR